MSICSAHQEPKEGCVACHTNMEDIVPGWAEKVAEAEKAGTHVCLGCGFEYYKTTDSCPLCSKKRD